MAFVTAAIMVVTALASAQAQRQQGKALKAKADADAQVREWQGRITAVNWRMKGVEILQKHNRVAAANNAIAGAVGMTGPPLGMAESTLSAAAADLSTTTSNATIAALLGGFEGENLRAGGRFAKKMADAQAFVTVLGAAGQASSAFGGGGSTTMASAGPPTDAGLGAGWGSGTTGFTRYYG